jgi:hypothetical protein
MVACVIQKRRSVWSQMLAALTVRGIDTVTDPALMGGRVLTITVLVSSDNRVMYQ